MTPCKICGEETDNTLNVKTEGVSICEDCCGEIYVEQAIRYDIDDNDNNSKYRQNKL